MKILLAILAGYLVGSLNFAGLIGRLTGKDPRHWGSGNLGAWNVGRRLGILAGLIVFAGDCLKGAAVIWLIRSTDWGRSAVLVAGLAAVTGHIYPFLFSFRGGKGLAVSLGVLAALDWHALLPPLSVAAGVLVLARNIHVAALAGIICLPLWLYFADKGPEALLFGLALSLMLLFTHRRNIRDLLTS